MKRLVLILSALLLGASALMAQDRPLNIALQGGFVGSGNENSRLFFDNNRATDLITNEFGIAVGYDFTSHFGARIAASYGKNIASSSKLDQFTFQSINLFADAMFSLVDVDSRFVPKVYAGIGGAKTSNFEDVPASLKSKINADGAFVPAGRVGVNLEFKLFSGIGIFADGSIEGYPDKYNGIEGGRAFEVRGVASAGVIFHF